MNGGKGVKHYFLLLASLSFVYSSLELARYIFTYMSLGGSTPPGWPFGAYVLPLEFGWVAFGPVVLLTFLIRDQFFPSRKE